jgi:hypothetical protein
VTIASKIGGALLLLIGAVWLLQGVDVLTDSVRAGQTRWAAFGGLAMVVGVVLFLRDKSAVKGAIMSVQKRDCT